MEGVVLQLAARWTVGAKLADGGFGQVFVATGDGHPDAVVKLVPKQPGAGRELLFVDLENVRNVIPIIESGEHGDFWVLVMPRAERSLESHLDEAAGPLPPEEVLAILEDITDALVDLDGKVVHRDLKPANVLFLSGHWCLADFGISRYAEASTAPDTQKFALSPPYAAPERWRAEHATSAADVYALGVIGYELVLGRRPFSGPQLEDFREQHLHNSPGNLSGTSTALATLIDECLFKAPDTRPSPANVRARLDRLRSAAPTGGLAALQAVNQAEVQRRAAEDQRRSVAMTEAERRADRRVGAQSTLDRISMALLEAIENAAPAATMQGLPTGGWWSVGLAQATLRFSGMEPHVHPWGNYTPPFDLVATATVTLAIPQNQWGYRGRSHSLWFGDIQQAGSFGWHETAFMRSAFTAQMTATAPFALDPGDEAGRALGPGMADFQVAWPFTKLEPDDLDDFISRWGGWLAQAASGTLNTPGTMPERAPHGSWRQA